jgi:hypothetical protein
VEVQVFEDLLLDRLELGIAERRGESNCVGSAEEFVSLRGVIQNEKVCFVNQNEGTLLLHEGQRGVITHLITGAR